MNASISKTRLSCSLLPSRRDAAGPMYSVSRVSSARLNRPERRRAVPAAYATVSAPQMTLMLPNAAESNKTDRTGIILLQCPDDKGAMVALGQLLLGFNCSVLQMDQFTDKSLSPARMFQRIEFDYTGVTAGGRDVLALEAALAGLARRYAIDWKVSYRPLRKRMAIFVSKMDHCLFDLLVRHHNSELQCDIPVVISNHQDLGYVAGMFGVDFEHLPLTQDLDKVTAKKQQEAMIEKVLGEACVDVVVLARYMQIFSEDFCTKNWDRTINIHHSFLPAFEGARPYHRAHERGVKIIGATAHYATSKLDAGPIIEQDITRITYRDNVQDMVRKGRDLERLVLARAVRWHLNDRVLVTPTGRTVVFQD